jgi:hypothetical protein
MRYSILAVVSMLLAVAQAAPAIIARDDDHRRDNDIRICRHLKVKGGGCIRCNLHSFIPLLTIQTSEVSM